MKQWLTKYNAWKETNKEKKAWRFAIFTGNLFLALLTMLPLLYTICSRVPFTYEVNDDSAMTQILDGSYTGKPDAHAVFIRYPLSLIMKLLYEAFPSCKVLGHTFTHVNWYVVVIVTVESIAMTAVLFRLLNHFQRNRILICAIYSMGFMKIWFPCFSSLTFSTAAAFMGCMSLLFFALESEKEAPRIWNILLLCFMIACAYSLRKQCFYMILPFLLLEFLRKYHFEILKSAKPWIILACCTLVIFGCNYMHSKAYGSQEWKKFLIYNHARAYLQDYGGFPDYNEEQDFFDAHHISEQENNSLQNYRYCLLDDCDPSLVEDLYAHVKEQGESLPLVQQIKKSLPKVKKYIFYKQNAPLSLKYASLYLWLVLIPVIPLTIIVQRKKGFFLHCRNFLYAAGSGMFLLAEWIYLAMNGRFPQRVEETIRLVMLTTALVILCHYLKLWKEAPLTRVQPLLQVVLTVLLVFGIAPLKTMDAFASVQDQARTFQTDKIEIINWCSEREDNIYIFDTNALITPLRPQDHFDNLNWYVSGSWLAYSPLYEEKLAYNGLDSLGSETLVKDNVYLITRSNVKPKVLLGLDEDKQVKTKKETVICTQNMNYYTVYKVTEYNEK